MPRERWLFVTGRLAEPSLRRVAAEVAEEHGFDYEIAVPNVTVAALMHAGLLRRRVHPAAAITQVMVPGYCSGDVESLAEAWNTPVIRGPKDLFDLPEFFSGSQRERPVLDQYDIEILAEINHAPRLSDAEILNIASHYRASGADLIDVGTVPGERWGDLGRVVKLLKAEGFGVSVDSFDRREVEDAVAAGAQLVLSCNSTNRDWARTLDVEWVAVPDTPTDFESLRRTVDCLAGNGVRFRIDPILEPIGFGFAASLERYFQARREWPEWPMMMGIGNLTELTEADTSGMNMLLAAVCQELRVGSVLTTEVINWARSAVAEFDVARRLACDAVSNRRLPKHRDSRLVMLRDARLRRAAAAELQEIANRLTDPNFRIFLGDAALHLMSADGHWTGDDPYEVFDRMREQRGDLEASHAFYLGYEFSKALTALTLGKNYTQDQPLHWGLLTREEVGAIERRRREKMHGTSPPVEDDGG